MNVIPLFGQTRDVVKERYALRTPAGFVPSCLPGWRDCTAIVQISPAMGARFCQLEVKLQRNGQGRGNTGNNEWMVYLAEGRCALSLAGVKHKWSAGGFAYIPPRTEYHFHQAANARLLIFQKEFEPLAGF